MEDQQRATTPRGGTATHSIPAKRGSAESVLYGSRAGDCGRDGCGSEAVVHDAAAAPSATNPRPAGGIAASRTGSCGSVAVLVDYVRRRSWPGVIVAS